MTFAFRWRQSPFYPNLVGLAIIHIAQNKNNCLLQSSFSPFNCLTSLYTFPARKVLSAAPQLRTGLSASIQKQSKTKATTRKRDLLGMKDAFSVFFPIFPVRNWVRSNLGVGSVLSLLHSVTPSWKFLLGIRTFPASSESGHIFPASFILTLTFIRVLTC